MMLNPSLKSTQLLVIFVTLILVPLLWGALPTAYALPMPRESRQPHSQAQATEKYAIRLAYRLVAGGDARTAAGDIEKAIAVFTSRLKALGLEAADVRRSDRRNEEIEVRLPADADLPRVKKVLGYFGLPQMVPVLTVDNQFEYLSRPQAEKAAARTNRQAYEILKSSDPEDEKWFVVGNKPVITGRDIETAGVAILPYGVAIDFTLTHEAAERMADWSEKHRGENLAIVINREVLSAPRVQGRIYDRGQIFGRFTRETAETLAIALRSGELPHRVTLISETKI